MCELVVYRWPNYLEKLANYLKINAQNYLIEKMHELFETWGPKLHKFGKILTCFSLHEINQGHELLKHFAG